MEIHKNIQRKLLTRNFFTDWMLSSVDDIQPKHWWHMHTENH